MLRLHANRVETAHSPVERVAVPGVIGLLPDVEAKVRRSLDFAVFERKLSDLAKRFLRAPRKAGYLEILR